MDIEAPTNDLNATHWVVLPDGQIIYYKIDDRVLLWHPHSKRWDNPGLVPYTLYCFDDFK